VTLYGLDRQAATLLDAMASTRMHHAWLMTGPAGVGKGTLARRAALRILAQASGHAVDPDSLEVPDGHPTAKLIAASSHPDFRLLERLTNDKGVTARSITVEQVRTFKASLALGTSLGDRRVVIVDAVDDLERGGANALLKSLEEPPAGTIFLLISRAPGRLLPTIRSRCRVLAFAPLPDKAVAAALRDRFPDRDDATLARLAVVGHGSVGAASRLADLDLGKIDDALTAIADTGDPTNATTVALAHMLAAKAATASYQAFLVRVPGFVAKRARLSSGEAMRRAAEVWSTTSRLAATAVPQSLVPEAVVAELCRQVGTLARL